MKAVVTRGVSPEAGLPLVGYWIAAGLFLDQILQIWSVVERVDVAVPAWRFQLALVLSGKILVLILGATIAIGTARLRRSIPPAPILRVGLVVAAIGALAMAVVLVVDGNSVSYAIPAPQFPGFTAARVRGIALLVAGVAIIWGLLRAVRSTAEPAPAPR